METGKRIAGLRKEYSLSQPQLADKMSVSQSTVAMWESGKRNVSNEDLLKMASFFNVSTDYLLGNTNNKRPMSPLENDDILTMYKIDTRGLTEDEIDDMREELEEYNDFMTKRLQEKIAKKKRK